ncbi:hypothetical protein MHU86_16750 [Fragilaria crotonensis]|nr:hypothetical protein MHU86_16750 [Fragilaria crotonensis]
MTTTRLRWRWQWVVASLFLIAALDQQLLASAFMSLHRAKVTASAKSKSASETGSVFPSRRRRDQRIDARRAYIGGTSSRQPTSIRASSTPPPYPVRVAVMGGGTSGSRWQLSLLAMASRRRSWSEQRMWPTK